MISRLWGRIRRLFLYQAKPDLVLIGIFSAVNLIVMVNAVLHHPKIGYDATEHLTYIQILSFKLPERNDSWEFYSPPLPYYLPSITNDVCNLVEPAPWIIIGDVKGKQECRTIDGKTAQFINFGLSIGTTILLLLVCEQIRPKNRKFKISVLLLLGVLTVFYKTFAQVRGEPYVVFFFLLSLYCLNCLLSDISMGRVLSLGISLGFLILSRQWGFFFFPALGLYVGWIVFQRHPQALNYVVSISAALVISALVGGWWYLHLYQRYGTVMPFNQQPSNMSVKQMYTLFRQSYLKDYELFTDPVDPHFDNSFFPVLYSDTWGDYWGFFTYIKPKSSFGENGFSNQRTILPYLGKVNIAALLPSAILLFGVIYALWMMFHQESAVRNEQMFRVFPLLFSLSSFLGFIWFVISYQRPGLSIIKATYIIQLFVATTILGGDFLEFIDRKSRLAYWLIICALAGVFLFELPAMISRYNWFYFF